MPLNIDFQQILLHLLNLTILCAGLYFLLYKPVKDFMAKREQKYAEMRDETEKALQEAEEKKSVYAEKIAGAEAEIETMRRAASVQMNEQNAAREEAAKKEADRIIEEARKEAENVRAGVTNQAQKEIAQMVSDAAEKLLLNQSTDASYEAFLSKAERSVSHGSEEE